MQNSAARSILMPWQPCRASFDWTPQGENDLWCMDGLAEPWRSYMIPVQVSDRDRATLQSDLRKRRWVDLMYPIVRVTRNDAVTAVISKSGIATQHGHL